MSFPQWRIWRINCELAYLYEKHGEENCIELDNTHLMTLKICPYHVNGGNDEDKKEIKDNQKKCVDYPEPNFFLDGCCYHYRPPTGHCDIHNWEKKDK
jgi:hypothetical protein